MTPLVTPARLASHLDDPNLVLLDATLPPVGVSPAPDTHARYLAQHLPGAVFFDIEAFSDHTSGLPHTLPSAAAFAAAIGALGVADTMTIVVYEQAGVFSAPRAWWMLRTFGAANISLLDGGLHAWLAAGLPVESGPVRRPAATFHATLDPAPEPRAGLRSGHMPGATSLPFTELVADGRLKPAAQLRDIFAAKGLDLTQPITTTCGSGVTAAVLALGLELAGARSVSLYDGSWAEYAQQPDAVILTNTPG
jgi:thiosulfate/3-mercaptopyruvate sulfurtransferase